MKSDLIINLKFGDDAATNNFIVFLIDIIALMSQPKNSCYSVGKLYTVFRKVKIKVISNFIIYITTYTRVTFFHDLKSVYHLREMKSANFIFIRTLLSY